MNAKDKKNMLPLHHACWKGQRDAAQFLLENGAQIAEVDSSLKTPLHWAVQFGHYETLVTLLDVSVRSLRDACHSPRRKCPVTTRRSSLSST